MRVAVLGATGLVGREMLLVLEQRSFPVTDLVPLASSRSAGGKVDFAGEDWVVREVGPGVFDNVDIALFSAGGEASRRWAPEAARRGAVVIDNSSAWRMDPEVPLVVPEVNPWTLRNHSGIIANPNCATIQAVVVLKPLHDAACLREFSAVTFQSVSGTGRAAMEELSGNSSSFLSGDGKNAGKVYPHDIAFNVLPHIGLFDEEGASDEEWKMIRESRKILALPDLGVRCTATRVPVFRGHSEAICANFEKPLAPAEARRILGMAPGVSVLDDPCRNLYPLARDAEGRDDVFVGRIRRDTGNGNGLMMWVVSDNLRKGAALNAVQIAELLV
ncbi:MAG: aspartate-semialdehyde dehydrogenase [Thermovirga sp.]